MDKINNDVPNHKGPALTLFGRSFAMPNSKAARIGVGIAFIIGGIFGFLPILGFWMVPLGLLILSHDFAYIRRKRRKMGVALGRRRSNFKNTNKNSGK